MTIYYRKSKVTLKGKVMIYMTGFLLMKLAFKRCLNANCIYAYFIFVCACVSIHTSNYLNLVPSNGNTVAKKAKPCLAEKGNTYILIEILKTNYSH